jgi:hypothetical protein
LQSFVTHHPGLYAVGFAGYFVVLWISVSWIVGRVGGWRNLGDQYQTERPFPAHTKRMQSGQMRAAMSYNHVLALGSDDAGIYLGVLFLFRLGNPPLFIPWPDIVIDEPKDWLIFKVQRLYLGPNRIPLRLRKSLVDYLQAGKSE